MRRLVATFALFVLVWSFAAPVAFAATAVAVPLCCRRDGKHKCANETSAMPGMSGSDVRNKDARNNARSVRSNSADCPYRSRAATPIGVAQPQASTSSRLQPPSVGLVTIVDGFFFKSPLATSNGQRGPPAFSL
jgi:hypothetical protein